MLKNLLRSIVVIFTFAASLLEFNFPWSVFVGIFAAFGGFALLGVVILCFFPSINVRHNIRWLIRSGVGAKISIMPFTHRRRTFYLTNYAMAISKLPISMKIHVDESGEEITLERISDPS